MVLTRAAPREVYRTGKDAPPIDIVAPDSRKTAMAALLEQRFSEAEPKIQAAINSSSLLPTKSLLPTMADLHALELTSTGDVVRTREAIQAFDGHARRLLNAELGRIKERVDDLHDLANEATLSEGRRRQLTYRGLTTPERDELRSLAETLLEIDEVVRDGESINARTP